MDYLHNVWLRMIGSESYAQNDIVGCKVVAFGNVLLDHTVRVPDKSFIEKHSLKLEEKGELELDILKKIISEAYIFANCKRNVGGAALNMARILRQLGTEVLFFGTVGMDTDADKVRQVLKEKTVAACLETMRDISTGQCICLVYENRTALYANIGASSFFPVEYLKNVEDETESRFLRPNDRKQIIYIEGFFIPHREEVCEFIIQNYIENRRRLAFNLSAVYIVEENAKTLLQLVQKAFFLFGNENEFKALAKCMDCENYEETAKKLMENSNPRIIVVTNGAEGATLLTNVVDEQSACADMVMQRFKASQVDDVLDTTGCGDAFVGAFLHAWLEKRQLTECMRMAADVAAKVATQIGCNLPSQEN